MAGKRLRSGWCIAAPLVALLVVMGCAQESEEVVGVDVTELTKQDARVGTGNEAVAGRQVTVHYTGWLYDPSRPENKGTQFDSSRDGEPLSFRLGSGQVIQGWDEGVAGMKVGGRRTLTIPSSMAYGPSGFAGAIPPNAALVFDVELLDVR